jgi:hypothetical protein
MKICAILSMTAQLITAAVVQNRVELANDLYFRCENGTYLYKAHYLKD